MRIVCISDTHTLHEGLTLPEGEVLVHAGDYTSLGRPEEHQRFREWFLAQPFDYKVVISGNHDFNAPGWAELWGDGVHYLLDSGCTIGKLRFWGSPYTPRFGGWAFMYPRPTERWNQIPEDIDVLITHGPPEGVLDQSWGDKEGVGCRQLRERVENLALQLHVFGHIHGSYGRVEPRGEGCNNPLRTTFVNASVVGEDYRLQNPPIVVDI